MKEGQGMMVAPMAGGLFDIVKKQQELHRGYEESVVKLEEELGRRGDPAKKN